jgi:poly-gamma-glutamate system protein
VAAAFSGSFPGLNLAVACASQALGARLLAVSSVTASTWGATDPGFTWPEMEARLVEAGVISAVSVAISVGGDADLGLDLEPDGRALAASIADDTAVRLHAVRLRAGSIDEAVRQRVALFDRRAGSLPIVAFVNVGGTAASLGREEGVLRLQSGWLIGPLPADAGNGLLAHVARRGTPVLHLLNIRQLAALWGIAG